MKYLLIIPAIFIFIGCATPKVEKVEKAVSAPIMNEKDGQPKIKYIYRGDFKIKYSGERIVWFKPSITESGDVVSEKTVTILPLQPTWSLKEEEEQTMQLSDEIIQYLKED